MTVLPLSEHDFNLNKKQFWNAIQLRYGWTIPHLPSLCVCGSKFDLQHCMSCKNGGFITLRHNSIRNANCRFKEICTDVKIEAPLVDLSGEKFQCKIAQTGNEVRTDIVASRYLKQTMHQCYVKN